MSNTSEGKRLDHNYYLTKPLNRTSASDAPRRNIIRGDEPSCVRGPKGLLGLWSTTNVTEIFTPVPYDVTCDVLFSTST